jgi:hypothetical protein
MLENTILDFGLALRVIVCSFAADGHFYSLDKATRPRLDKPHDLFAVGF